jgi:hypothetical protein
MKAVFKSLVNENVKSPKKRRQSLKYTNKDEALTVMLEVLTDKSTPQAIQKGLLELLRHTSNKVSLLLFYAETLW